jgi:hypothetical protein
MGCVHHGMPQFQVLQCCALQWHAAVGCYISVVCFVVCCNDIQLWAAACSVVRFIICCTGIQLWAAAVLCALLCMLQCCAQYNTVCCNGIQPRAAALLCALSVCCNGIQPKAAAVLCALLYGRAIPCSRGVLLEYPPSSNCHCSMRLQSALPAAPTQCSVRPTVPGPTSFTGCRSGGRAYAYQPCV